MQVQFAASIALLRAGEPKAPQAASRPYSNFPGTGPRPGPWSTGWLQQPRCRHSRCGARSPQPTDPALELGLDGIIATNTTLTRDGLASDPGCRGQQAIRPPPGSNVTPSTSSAG